MAFAVKAQFPGGAGLRQAQAAARAPWDLEAEAKVPVSRPGLPRLEAAMRYLRQIDEVRLASEADVLTRTLEERVSAHFGLPSGSVAACANGTIALTVALQAAARSPGYCILPAWTHAATAQAALAAGLTPYIVDVDRETGALTPALAWRAVSEAPGPVAAVLPVAPFGRAPEAEGWDDFRHRTDVPVVLDAAGAFAGLEPGAFPAVVSLRSGKPLAAGEGGLVLSWDPAVIHEVRRRSNHGMGGRLEACVPGTNGQLSEHAAAYGLAALDLWPLRRSELAAVRDYYRAALADLEVATPQEGAGSTCCIEAPEPAVLAIETALAEAGVATRRWYGQGLRGHAAFQDLPGGPTPVTDELARRTLGLPCWPGLTPDDLAPICETVRKALNQA